VTAGFVPDKPAGDPTSGFVPDEQPSSKHLAGFIPDPGHTLAPTPKGTPSIYSVNPNVNVMGDYNTNWDGFGKGGIRPQFRTIVDGLTKLGNHLGIYDFDKGHHYAPNDPHLDGRAMDVDTLNGETVGEEATPNVRKFVSQALAEDPKVRVGVPAGVFSQLQDKTGRVFQDSPGHIHVELSSITYAPTKDAFSSYLGHVADSMEGAAKKLAGFGGAVLASAKNTPEFGLAQRAAAATPGEGAVQSRLSPVIKRVGEAADLPFAIGNATLRTLGGDDAHGLGLLHSMSQPPKGSPGDAFLGGAWAMFHPISTMVEFNKQLDTIGSEFSWNNPKDILYWASQPGVMQRITDSEPTTHGGIALKLALGMHADLARLKPSHPYLTGAETTVAELLNPTYFAAGAGGSMLTRSFLEDLQAARAGKYGLGMQKTATALAHAPIAGNRYVEMGDESGIAGEQHYSNWAQHMENVTHNSQAKFTSTPAYKDLSIEDQVNIKRIIKAPKHGDLDTQGMPVPRDPKYDELAAKKVAGISLGDRAQVISGHTHDTDAAVREMDPDMANRMQQDDYTTMGGAWKKKYAEGPGGTRGAGVAPTFHREIHPTVESGEAAGGEIDPNWVPAAADAMHDAKMRQYETFLRFILGPLDPESGTVPLVDLSMRSGKKHVMDATYDYKDDNGEIFSASQNKTGREGFDAATKSATEYGQKKAYEVGSTNGWDDEKIASMVPHYTQELWDKMRDLFMKKNPEHIFDPHMWLGAPALRGKAMSRISVDEAIDVHPALNRMYASKPSEYKNYLEANPKAAYDGSMAAHNEEVKPSDTGWVWFQNLNSFVRQALVTGLGYHGLFNVAPNVVMRGAVPLPWVARALGLDRSVEIPQEWMDNVVKAGVVAEARGVGLHFKDPHLLGKMLTVAYNHLPKGKFIPFLTQERLLKAAVQASKWNQDLTFGFQEHRLAAVQMHFLEEKGMTRAQAARETQKLINDSQNMTPIERKLGMQNWTYFYHWHRGQYRNATMIAAQQTRKIMAPIRGIQTANQLQGDDGTTSGTGLSLRSAMEGLRGPLDAMFPGLGDAMYGWGTDEHGSPKYVSVPGPIISYGGAMMRMGGGLTGLAGLGAAGDETGKVFEQRATSSLTPLASLALGMAITEASPADTPAGYNSLLWDKDAPSPGAKWLTALKNWGAEYTPPVARGTLGLGPSVYSEPNTGTQKAMNSALDELRLLLEKSNKAGNYDTSREIWTTLQQVISQDPAATLRAKAQIPGWKQALGILSSSSRSYGAPSRF
jgi:hypothetical protein